MNLTASEKATLHFYEWEYLGRGYYHFDKIVAIEPTFVPFYHKTFRDVAYQDDGKVPNLFGRISNLLIDKKPKEEENYTPKPIKPTLSKATRQLVGFSFSFQKGQEINTSITVELINMLAFSEHAISFEIIGTKDTISIQFVCGIEDKARLFAHLNAYFPTVIIKIIDIFALDFNLENTIAIVDFGLEDEFMRPIHMPTSFQIDTLTSIIATLDGLEYGDTALLQIIFKGVTAPWSKNLLHAVSDGVGGSFFTDAPEMLSCAKSKVAAPLFSAVVRIAAQGSTDARSEYLASQLARSIASISASEFNKLIPLSNEGYQYEHHLNNIFERTSNRFGMLLNSNELASFIHYPNKSIVSHKLGFHDGKTKLIPQECTHQKYLIGINSHNNIETLVSLTEEARLRHTHIIGATGVGKSTLIANMLLEDVAKGNGCAIFDPHGDIIDDILLRIPEYRKEDVILIDPSDLDFPIGFNLLHATTEAEKIVLSSDLVSSFKRHATAWGDKMSAVLSQAINTFLESDKGGTLIELKRFLLEDSFRQQFLDSVDDPAIHYYWEHEYYMVKKGIAPLLTRIDTFLRPKTVRYMLAQKQGIDFAQCIQEKKIVLLKLSQGSIGEENSYLLGSLFLSKFNQAAQARQSLPKEARHPYYIYLDEFQNFITPSISVILSSARKYGLGLILAHQELAQIDDTKTLNSVISNPYIRICFRLGDSDAKKLESGFLYFEQTDLQSLKIGETIVRVGSSTNDFNMQTKQMDEINENEATSIKEFIIQNTRNNYAKPRAEIENLLTRLLPKFNKTKSKNTFTKEVKSKLSKKDSQITELKTSIEKEKAITEASDFEEQKEKLKIQAEKSKINREHNYLQTTIKKLGQDYGFLSTIEKETSNGGRVDVALEQDGFKIACEISVTNKVDYEIKNLEKCILEKYDLILMISKNKKHLNKIKEAAFNIFSKSNLKRIYFIEPEFVSDFLNITKTPTKPITETIKGFRVVTEYEESAKNDMTNIRQNLAQILLKNRTK